MATSRRFKPQSAFCIVVGAALAVNMAGAPAAITPKVSEIVRRSAQANAADWKAQPSYGHREHSETIKLDSNGAVRSRQAKTFEVMMIEGSPYERLVETEGKPLTPAQEQQEQKKLKAEMVLRQKESPAEHEKRVIKFQNERADEGFLMEQMVKAFSFNLVGEESVSGVDCYVLDAIPDPQYQPPVEKARVLTGMRGRLFVDKSKYHWVRVEAEVTRPVAFGLFVARVKPGTRFTLDQAPVGDVWLPKHFSQSVNASVFGLYGLRNAEEQTYSEYHETLLDAGIRKSAN